MGSGNRCLLSSAGGALTCQQLNQVHSQGPNDKAGHQEGRGNKENPIGFHTQHLCPLAPVLIHQAYTNGVSDVVNGVAKTTCRSNSLVKPLALRSIRGYS